MADYFEQLFPWFLSTSLLAVLNSFVAPKIKTANLKLNLNEAVYPVLNMEKI